MHKETGKGDTMTLTIKELSEVAERAIKAGYPPLLLINGEYYDIKEDGKL